MGPEPLGELAMEGSTAVTEISLCPSPCLTPEVFAGCSASR